MSNPTTPFSWQMPTATDLVTDLPADFEVFGQAVATSMADLLGGASGYILSKASATDMDFTWIANDQGDITGVTATTPLTGGGTSGAITVGIQDALTTQKGAVQLSDSTSTTSSILAATPTAVKSAYDLADAAIAKTTVTTAGDIIYRNATVPVRLAIGTAGQVLKVNAGATAPEWGVASAASALTFLGSSTFTTAASTSIDSVFSATYQNYLVMLNISTGDGTLTMNFRASGSDNTTSNYSYYNDYMAFSNTWSRSISNLAAQSSMLLNQGMDSSNLSIPFTIMNPNLAQKTAVTSPMIAYNYNTTGNYTSLNTGFFNATTQFDGIKFTAGTNMTGTLKIYGIANS